MFQKTCLLISGGIIVVLIIATTFFALPDPGEEKEITPQEVGNNHSQPEQSKTEATTSEVWLHVIIIILGLALIASMAITFYLYKWRKILLSKPHYLLPEDQGRHLNQLNSCITQLSKSIEQNTTNAARKTDQISVKVSNLLETFMTMQTTLDQRDKEIQRLKRGYDAEIFRKFIGRFIRIDNAINDFKATEEIDLQESLNQIQSLLHDALAECNVECFQPDLGADYRSAFGVADSPRKESTDDPNKNFMISEIVESGYYIRGNEGKEIVKPAKVKIYTFQEEGERK